MTQAEFDFTAPSAIRSSLPRGKVGNTAARLLDTVRTGRPVSPLDLVKEPSLYGTDPGRNIRHAARWIEEHGHGRVESRREPGAVWCWYWVKRTDKE